jgi:hypothetical protein
MLLNRYLHVIKWQPVSQDVSMGTTTVDACSVAVRALKAKGVTGRPLHLICCKLSPGNCLLTSKPRVMMAATLHVDASDVIRNGGSEHEEVQMQT